MMDENVEAIVKRFDNDVELARVKARGQDKVLINLYVSED
jgi:hypothetical protein